MFSPDSSDRSSAPHTASAAFLPLWPALIGIGLSIPAAALAVAWQHARQSAKVVIAEAMRHQA